MYGAVCFPEIERNQSFCDKEQRFLTKCMPVYDDEGDYENPQPTKWPHFAFFIDNFTVTAESLCLIHSLSYSIALWSIIYTEFVDGQLRINQGDSAVFNVYFIFCDHFPYLSQDEGGWLKNLYSHHTWEADDKEFIEHVNKRECGDYDHSLMLPDRMYLEWCQTPDTNNSIKGSFYPCITEKAFEEKHPNYASEILRDMVYLGLPFIAFILTSSTTLVLVKFFRRSKRILVYINMFLSMSLFSLCYVVNIWIYRQYAKMRLENSEKIINVLGTYINSLMEGKHPGHNGTEELFLMQHDLFLEPKHCNTSHEEQHYTQMNCSTLDYLEDKAEKAGCGREEFRDDKSSLATYCIIFGLLESYFWMTKFTWFILQAVYLVMLNLCTYNSLSIFQSNMFIWIGWLAPLPFLAGFASNFFFSKTSSMTIPTTIFSVARRRTALM
ncbi:unnamed protein product [Oikopleura dioica]|nr:unnamed protein product [Oikopleura dioica]